MVNIPNLITLLNLICGALAIYFTFTDSPELVIILFACSLICDFLDGFLARLLNQASELGKQLDSLADLISFGLLPTFLLLNLIEKTIDPVQYPFFFSIFILAAAAAYRLAKFNLITTSNKDFSGMPSPAMAWITMGIWVYCSFVELPEANILNNAYVILFMGYALAWLMNVNVPFLKFTIRPLKDANTIKSLILVLLFILSAIIDWRLTALITGAGYVLLSLLSVFSTKHT